MYYRVEYDDDDSEDLSLSELEPVLLPSSGGLAADGPAAESLGKRVRVDGSKPAAEGRPQEGSTEAPPPPSSRATRKPLPRTRVCQVSLVVCHTLSKAPRRRGGEAMISVLEFPCYCFCAECWGLQQCRKP